MAPRLTFVPPLGSTTKVPLGHNCASAVTFKIYVNVYREWLNRFRNEGRRIEVWSDLPGGGRNQGEWGETPFVEQSNKSSGTATPMPVAGEDDLHISLLSPDVKPEHAPTSPIASSDRKVTLIATFSLPQTYSHYSYTFRIAGPNNRMEWLGSMGTNGVVVVGEPGHRAGFEEEQVASTGIWSSLDGSAARKWEREDSSSDLVEIGRFKNVDMVGWAFGKHGSSEKVAPAKTSSGANLFLLHPRLDARIASRPYTDPPSSIVISSPDDATILTEDGILMTSAQSISVQEFYPFTLPSDLQQATSDEWETLEVPEGAAPGFILVKSTGAAGTSLVASSVPGSLAILPAVSGDTLPSTSTISLPLPFIFQLQPNQPLNMLYSPVNDAVHVLDFSTPQVQSIQNVSFKVGRDGGEMIVVPAYEIGDPEVNPEELHFPEETWTVGILEPQVASVAVLREPPALTPADDPATPQIELEADVVVLSTPLVTAAQPPLDEVEDLDLAEKPAPEETQMVDVARAASSIDSSRLKEFVLSSFLTIIHVILGILVIMLAQVKIDDEDQPKEKVAVEGGVEEKTETVEPSPEVPSQDEQLESPVEEKKDPAKYAAQKAILTPPMTPPQLPSTSLGTSNKLGITTVAIEDYFNDPQNPSPVQLPERAVEEPTIEVTEAPAAPSESESEPTQEDPNHLTTSVPMDKKTKLYFTLPAYATHFKLLLHHAGDDEAADIHRIRVELDHKEVTTLRPSLGAHSWLLDVDASHKTAGRVQVSVV